MYICKKCFVTHLSHNAAIIDSERLPRYFCTVMFNKKCSKCKEITKVDFISDKELERIITHERTS